MEYCLIFLFGFLCGGAWVAWAPLKGLARKIKFTGGKEDESGLLSDQKGRENR
jgi:hypothetical protein